MITKVHHQQIQKNMLIRIKKKKLTRNEPHHGGKAGRLLSQLRKPKMQQRIANCIVKYRIFFVLKHFTKNKK